MPDREATEFDREATEFDAMVERGGRALCDWENKREVRREQERAVLLHYEDWRDEFDDQARAVIIAALEGEQGG